MPYDFVRTVRRSRVDGLLVCLINIGQQHQDLRLVTLEIFTRLSFEGTALVNGMDDRPRQRKERHLVAFERQQPVSAYELPAVVGLERRVEHLRLELNDLIAPAAIRNAELERCHLRISCDDRLPAEDDGGRRTRKAGKEQPGRKRLIHQPNERLERHEQVCGETVRAEL